MKKKEKKWSKKKNLKKNGEHVGTQARRKMECLQFNFAVTEPETPSRKRTVRKGRLMCLGGD